MEERHISAEDLERYYLGMVRVEADLARIEEHLLWCHKCLDRMEHTERYIDAVRNAAFRAEFDIESRLKAIGAKPASRISSLRARADVMVHRSPISGPEES